MTRRRRRHRADVITADFLYHTIRSPIATRFLKRCISDTRDFGIEWGFEIIVQFRGGRNTIIYFTPPYPGNPHCLETNDSARRQIIFPWHLRERRPARKPSTSSFTLFEIHTAPLKLRGKRETLVGLPSICQEVPKGSRNFSGDFINLRDLRREIEKNHQPEKMRPIGIEIRVRPDDNFCTLFQERAPVTVATLLELDRGLRGQFRINGAGKQLIKEAGYNFIASRIGRTGIELTVDGFTPFAFDPGYYNGR